MQQPPGQGRHPWRQPPEQLCRQPGPVKDLAHPDEQRQRGERPARRRRPDGGDHRVARGPRREDLHSDPGHADQREADPDPGPEQQEQDEEEEDDGPDVLHARASPACAYSVELSRMPGSPYRTARQRWSTSAMAKIADPIAMPSWGIQRGVASCPWLTSPSMRDTRTAEAACQANQTPMNEAMARHQISAQRRWRPRAFRSRPTRMWAPRFSAWAKARKLVCAMK